MNKFQSFPSFIIKKLVFVVSSFGCRQGDSNKLLLSFFPQLGYPEFKLAENVLQLINSQGLIW